MKSIISLCLFLLLGACASKPIQWVPMEPESKPETQEPKIDLSKVQSSLKMERALEELGYAEKPFNTCEMGYGYSSNRDCRKEHFILIHFQLLCRDTHQDSYTEAVRASQMRPLKGRFVRWNLSELNGSLYLDDRGYGQIKTASGLSQKDKRLKISIDNDNLYIKAGDFNRIVTPSNWCY